MFSSLFETGHRQATTGSDGNKQRRERKDTQAVCFCMCHYTRKDEAGTKNTVGPVMRVRGIKNKYINPVRSLSLCLSREVRLRFARQPLRPLCLSCDTLCLLVESGPKRLSLHPIYVRVQLRLITDILSLERQALMPPLPSFYIPKLSRTVSTQTVSWSWRVTCTLTVTHPFCKPQMSSCMDGAI